MGLGTLANCPGDKTMSLKGPARPSRRSMEALEIGAPRTPAPGDAQSGATNSPATFLPRTEVRPLDVDWSQIVRRCMDGDSGAWAEMVRTHHKRVYGLCYRFTGNVADAEDLTQDVFLKIYSNLASFDTSRGSLQVWITTMTRNLLVDNFRRTRNQRATGSLDEGWESAEDLKPVDRLTARGPSPLESAARRELAKMVQNALARVSLDLREADVKRTFTARTCGPERPLSDGAERLGARVRGAARGGHSKGFTGYGLQGDCPGAGHPRGDGKVPHQQGTRGTCAPAGT